MDLLSDLDQPEIVKICRRHRLVSALAHRHMRGRSPRMPYRLATRRIASTLLRRQKKKATRPLPIEVTNGSDAAAMIYRMGSSSNAALNTQIGSSSARSGKQVSTGSPMVEILGWCPAQCQRR